MQDLSEDKKYRIQNSLSGLIKIDCVESKIETSTIKMYAMYEYLKMRFPNIFRTLQVESINGSMLIRFPSQNTTQKPVLCLSYMQVTLPSGKWSRPYFSGDISGGYVYGKGCINSKGNMCAILSCVEQMLENCESPNFDLYILLIANRKDAVKCTQYFKDNGLHFEYILDEGGAVISKLTSECKMPVALVAVGEQKKIKFLLTSFDDEYSTAFERLSICVAKCRKMIFDKIVITNEFRLLINNVIKQMSAPKKLLYKSGIFANNIIKRRSIKNRFFKKMLAPTVNFSFCDNAVSERYGVSLQAEMGISSEHDEQKAASDFMKFTSSCDVNCQIISKEGNSYRTNTDLSSYENFCEAIKAKFDNVEVFPFIKSSKVDYSSLESICDNIIRFKPFVLKLKEYISTEIIDECISADNLNKAVEFYRYIFLEADRND